MLKGHSAPKLAQAVGYAALAITALSITPPAHAAKEPLVGTNYGPEPEWARYKEMGEAALKDRLIDPDSAKIRWPYGYVKRGYTPFMAHRVYGYATCGFVNSRNRMGGYAGEVPFAIVIDSDQVLVIDMARSSTDMTAEACGKAGLPPASNMTVDVEETGDAVPSGLTVTSVPEGAYIASVAQGSASALSGLKPGMVISGLNGIGTRGLPIAAIQKMMANAVGRLSVQTIGGGHFSINLRPIAPGDEP